jgi:hypothetical protein
MNDEGPRPKAEAPVDDDHDVASEHTFPGFAWLMARRRASRELDRLLGTPSVPDPQNADTSRHPAE